MCAFSSCWFCKNVCRSSIRGPYNKKSPGGRCAGQCTEGSPQPELGLQGVHHQLFRRRFPRPEGEVHRGLVDQHAQAVDRLRAPGFSLPQEGRLGRVEDDVADGHALADPGVIQVRLPFDVREQADGGAVDQDVGPFEMR